MIKKSVHLYNNHNRGQKYTRLSKSTLLKHSLLCMCKSNFACTKSCFGRTNFALIVLSYISIKKCIKLIILRALYTKTRKAWFVWM